MREEITIFRRSKGKGNEKFLAEDYGHRAFPITMKGKHRKEPTNSVAAQQYEIIPSREKLKGGIGVGDRVRHSVLGNGTVLSITATDTIFEFDAVGLRLCPTVRAYEHLAKF